MLLAGRLRSVIAGESALYFSWQEHHEAGAMSRTGSASYTHPAAVLADNFLTDPQTHTCPLLPFGGVENLKEMGERLWRHTGTVIGNRYLNSLALLTTPAHGIAYSHE